MHGILLSMVTTAICLTSVLSSPISANGPAHSRLSPRQEETDPPPSPRRKWGQYELCLAASQEEPPAIEDATYMRLEKRADPPAVEGKKPPRLMHIDEYFRMPQLPADLHDPYAGLSKQDRAWRILEQGCFNSARLLGQTPTQRYNSEHHAREAGVMRSADVRPVTPPHLQEQKHLPPAHLSDSKPKGRRDGQSDDPRNSQINLFNAAFGSVRDHMMPYFFKPGGATPKGAFPGAGSPTRPLIRRPVGM